MYNISIDMTVIPHFFKARSRIGLLNKPNGQKQYNIGVENGPDYVLDEVFLKNFGKHSMSSFNFPLPENIPDNQFIEELIRSTTEFKKQINKELKKGEMQIVIGGDHTVSLSSVLAVLERAKKKNLGYIHFDSHGDINLFKDSPSENFHGMYLRPLFDNFDETRINNLVKNKLPANNLLMIGNLDLDEGEKRFIKNKNIKTISGKHLEQNKAKAKKMLKEFTNSFDYLHVSFDGDVLDKTIFPSTGIPTENGIKLEDVIEFLQIIKTHPNLSLDLAEFNPHKRGATKSKKVFQQILNLVLK